MINLISGISLCLQLYKLWPSAVDLCKYILLLQQVYYNNYEHIKLDLVYSVL